MLSTVIKMMMHGRFYSGIPNYSTEDKKEHYEMPSTWLIAPYFLLFFTMYLINTVLWPLLFMERACRHFLPTVNPTTKVFGEDVIFNFNKPSNSCILGYINNASNSNVYHVNKTNAETIETMIVAAFASGIVALISYFLIWKPLVTRCRGIAIFLLPVCIIFQTVLFVAAQDLDNFTGYKCTLIAAVVLPSMHCNFQGAFLLVFHMTKVPKVNTKREVKTIHLQWSHSCMILSIMLGGLFISGCFEFTYNFILFIQLTLGCVALMYALALIPEDCSLYTEEEDSEENENETTDKEDEQVTSSEEEEFFMGQIAREKKDGGLLSKSVNLLKEAPMLFTETSYKKESIVIIEVTVFTIAMIADVNISGPYLIQHPIFLDLRTYGYCIAAQGIIRICSMSMIKCFTHFSQLTHGFLICLAAFNYITYYITLSLASSKAAVIVIMCSNLFGGLAFPTLFSFTKLNFTDTLDTVLEMSMLCSLVVTMGFTPLEYFIYEKTRIVFPGAIFVLTASLIAISLIIMLATYISTTIKNQRKTKYYADRLLNNYQ